MFSLNSPLYHLMLLPNLQLVLKQLYSLPSVAKVTGVLRRSLRSQTRKTLNCGLRIS
ncbi:MAG: hypothetical protein V7K15_01530 [Nostoc sp.]